MVIVDLPKAVRQYFDSRNAFDVAAALAQFEDDAFVEDENVEHRGRDSIREWLEETEAKYHPRFETQAAKQVGDHLVVTTVVSGTFPGSPLSIDHAFVLSGEKINRLVIG